jgi:hypothetical protein
MDDRPNLRRPAAPRERSQTALWFVAVGLAIAVFSRIMRDQMIGDVVLLFGLAFAAIAMIYWLVKPTHGWPR